MALGRALKTRERTNYLHSKNKDHWSTLLAEGMEEIYLTLSVRWANVVPYYSYNMDEVFYIFLHIIMSLFIRYFIHILILKLGGLCNHQQCLHPPIAQVTPSSKLAFVRRLRITTVNIIQFTNASAPVVIVCTPAWCHCQ